MFGSEKYVNSNKGSQSGERAQDRDLKKTVCFVWGREGYYCMVSRARSGTGSGGHRQPAFSATEGKSFLMVLRVGRWSGLLPENVSCRPRSVLASIP